MKQCCQCRCHEASGERLHQSPHHTPDHCHINMVPHQQQHQHRYVEKARSYDPFLVNTGSKGLSPQRTLRKQESSAHRHHAPKGGRSIRCSASPGPAFIASQHLHHHNHHQHKNNQSRRWRGRNESDRCDMCRRWRCQVCEASSDEPSSLSSSRAASDSSLTSIPTVVKVS